jgi:hypothetical protein
MRLARQLAAVVAALALVAALPLVCPCPLAPSQAAGAHDCCAPRTGVQVVDDGCCGGSPAVVPEALAAAAPATTPAPAVAAFAAGAPVLARPRLVTSGAPRYASSSPPTVLRI